LQIIKKQSRTKTVRDCFFDEKIPTPNYKFLPQNIAKKKAVCYTEIEEGGVSPMASDDALFL